MPEPEPDDDVPWTSLYGFGQRLSHFARVHSVRLLPQDGGSLEARARARAEVRFEALDDGIAGASAFLWLRRGRSWASVPLKLDATAAGPFTLVRGTADIEVPRGHTQLAASLHGRGGYAWTRLGPAAPDTALCVLDSDWFLATGPVGRARERLRLARRALALRRADRRHDRDMARVPAPHPVPPAPAGDPGLDVVFVHPPKVAGTSFNTFLKASFTPEACLRILHERDGYYRGPPIDLALVRGKRPGARVVHGHFTAHDAGPLVAQSGARVVTWVRDPVDRVLSHYYFNQRMRARRSQQDQVLVALPSLDRLLHTPFFRDRMHLAFRGRPLSAFDFVGVQARFAEDLADFAAMLGKPLPAVPRDNTGERYRDNLPKVGPDARAAIARLNRRDQALYEEALALRAARRAQAPG